VEEEEYPPRAKGFLSRLLRKVAKAVVFFLLEEMWHSNAYLDI